MQHQAKFSCGARTNLDARFGIWRKKREDFVDAGLAAFERSLRRKGMHKAGGLVTAVAKINGLQFFAALIEGEELEVGGCVIEPGDAFGGGAFRASWHDDFQSTKVAAGFGFLTAVIEPEDAEGENAVDG